MPTADQAAATDGIGLVGTRDGKIVVLRAGESVWSPAGEEHFTGYGAAELDRRPAAGRHIPVGAVDAGNLSPKRATDMRRNS